MAARGGQPLVLVDIAVPRDIEPAVAEVPGVTVLDMDDLGAFADRGLAERRREIDAVCTILDEELERFQAATSAREVARSEEHTSELQSLMRTSYAVFCLKTKNH